MLLEQGEAARRAGRTCVGTPRWWKVWLLFVTQVHYLGAMIGPGLLPATEGCDRVVESQQKPNPSVTLSSITVRKQDGAKPGLSLPQSYFLSFQQFLFLYSGKGKQLQTCGVRWPSVFNYLPTVKKFLIPHHFNHSITLSSALPSTSSNPFAKLHTLL